MHLHNGLHRFNTVQAAYAHAVGEVDVADFSGIERAGETLTPVIDLWSRPEWAYLREERLWWILDDVSAVAAERGILALQNPVASNTIAVVQLFFCSTGARIAVTTDFTQVETAVTRGIGRDGRLQRALADERSVCRVIERSEAVANVGTQVSALTAGVDRVVPQVLTPGREVRIFGSADNTAFVACYCWSERRALHGELE